MLEFGVAMDVDLYFVFFARVFISHSHDMYFIPGIGSGL